MERNEPDITTNLSGSVKPLEHSGFQNDDSINIPVHSIALLIVDLWKIAERAKCQPVSERVLAACERAVERIKKLGFIIDDMSGRLYDTNMRLHVVEHDGGVEPVFISECLSPAIYYQDVLICEAEVITKGT